MLYKVIRSAYAITSDKVPIISAFSSRRQLRQLSSDAKLFANNKTCNVAAQTFNNIFRFSRKFKVFIDNSFAEWNTGFATTHKIRLRDSQ